MDTAKAVKATAHELAGEIRKSESIERLWTRIGVMEWVRRPRRAGGAAVGEGSYSQVCAQVCWYPQLRASRSRRRCSGGRGRPVRWSISCRASPPAEDLTTRWSRQHKSRRSQPQCGQQRFRAPAPRASRRGRPRLRARSLRGRAGVEVVVYDDVESKQCLHSNAPLDRRSAPVGCRPDGLSGPCGPVMSCRLRNRTA